MYSCILNNIKSDDIGVYVKNRINIPQANLLFNEIEVKNRDGLIYEQKRLEDIKVEVSFNFATKTDNYNSKLREFKTWIFNSINKKMTFTDDMEFFYIVKKIEVSNLTRRLKRVFNATVTFTCEPFEYLYSGLDTIENFSTIYNNYYISMPIYIIEGSGAGTISVNSKVIELNVNDKCTIDTSLGIVLDKNNKNISSSMKGYYQDLYLKEGMNNISYSNNFTVKCIPNWRLRA